MKKKILVWAVLLMSSLCVFSQNKSIDYTSQKIARYQKDAKSKPFFVPLEIGEITPQGWLLQWAERAAHGITGHLDEYSDVFKYGWKGFGFNAQGVNPDGTGWPIEQCSYWLDGATKLAYILRDTALIHKTSDRLNLVVNGVLNGSNTFIYWRPKSITNDNFNNWGHSLMGRALVSYYQATHDPKILKALVKVYSQFHLLAPTENFRLYLNPLMDRMRGSTNIDAMNETYLMSGNKAILDSIVAFSKNPDMVLCKNYWNTLDGNQPMTEKQQLHGVSFYEVFRVPAMMSLWTGNQQDLQTSRNILSWGEKQNMLPYGICTTQEYLCGVGSIRNTETCNIPTSMWSFLWMLRLTGESNWCDKIENVFFNAGPAPIARDFVTMCYFQSPNRFSTKIPDAPKISGPGGLKYTKTGNTLCCVGNMNNTIPDYISNMWMATMDNGLAFTLYGPCRVSKNINGTNVKINCTTQYPFNDSINISLHLSKVVAMPLYFKIPGWCKNASVLVNNKRIDVRPSKGFMRIERRWNNNDKILLVLPKKVCIQQQRETPYQQVSYYNSTPEAHDTQVNNPFEYVTYGPLLFSLPIKDINPNQEATDVKFNYALNINPASVTKDIQVVKKSMTKDWDWRIEDAPICLKVKAKEFDWTPTQAQPLPNAPVVSDKNATIELVPYGCTKFRVTMFPVTEETWTAK